MSVGRREPWWPRFGASTFAWWPWSFRARKRERLERDLCDEQRGMGEQYVEWAVVYPAGRMSTGADGQAEAEEWAQWIRGGYVMCRTVQCGPWNLA